MALTGIQIYKLLPQTNCKECGFPTCLAFAMKLAAKQVELSACPYVNEDAKAQLAESAAPPIRLVSLGSANYEVKVGNEVVLFRHEKTFYNKPGVFIKIKDDSPVDVIKSVVMEAEKFSVNYVGMDLHIDGFAIEGITGNRDNFVNLINIVREISKRPLILISSHPDILASGLEKIPGEHSLICYANQNNWQEMADVSKKFQSGLAILGDKLETLADLTEKVKSKEVEDLVLVSEKSDLSTLLAQNTQIRRLAIKKNFRPLGFPTLCFAPTLAAAVQAVTKYAGIIVLDKFEPAFVYPLLVLRQNIYTDPQKPIQVQPGLYEINNPSPHDPVLVTTNFSITYFSVANEVESSGLPAWLLVTDAEGMSVLTAWAAGKFDAERIAKAVKSVGVEQKISQKRIVIPGHVAVLSGELEGELPGWEIKVGPREAVDIPKYIKQVL